MIRFSNVSLIRGTKVLLEGADATLNPGGVRIDLPRGDVSYAQLHRVMPFDNAVVRLTISSSSSSSG